MEYSSYEERITVTDLKDYTLCKAIPWIRRKVRWREPETFSLREGKRDPGRPKIEGAKYEVRLSDPKTGLHGVVDVIAGDRVIEVKKFDRGKFAHFRLQLLAYSYLANRNGYRVREAVLLMDGKERLRVEVNEEHMRYVEGLAMKVREVVDSDRPPAVDPSPSLCRACQYRRVCLSTPFF